MKQTAKLLEDVLNQFFDRVEFLDGSIYHLNTQIDRDSKKFIEAYKNSSVDPHEFVLGSKLIISDISGPTDNGWWYNYPTSANYIVRFDEYQKKANDLVTMFCQFAICQYYEAFETFLKDILAAYCYLNPNIGRAIRTKHIRKRRHPKWYVIPRLFSKDKNSLTSFTEWKNEVRKFNTGKNNKKLFEILRSLSSSNFKFESDNNTGFSLKIWYNHYSIIRHSITHSNGFILNNQYNEINKQSYSEYYFPLKKDGDRYRVSIQKQNANAICKLISEYAFQIFKYLSYEMDHEWRVLKNIRGNYEV